MTQTLGLSIRVLMTMVIVALAGEDAVAQALGARGGPQPNLVTNIERPLRYHPDDGDFVIENGAEFFNRPLYGGNTAFRVDAGDKPEFVLYLPGRGGNFRLGVRRTSSDGAHVEAKWLFDAAHVVARYRPGEMLYEIRDASLLGESGVLHVSALALSQTEGLIVRAEIVAGVADPGRAREVVHPGPAAGATVDQTSLELIIAYGGVNGQRGQRDGDIGTERVPISQWFQLQPEFCRDNVFTIENGNGAPASGRPTGSDDGDGASASGQPTGSDVGRPLAGVTSAASRDIGFTLRAPLPRNATATLAGAMPPNSTLALADATKWGSIDELLASAIATENGGRAAADRIVTPSGRETGGRVSDAPGDRDSRARGASGDAPSDEATRARVPALPVMLSRTRLRPNEPLFFCVQRVADGADASAAPADDLATYREVGAPQATTAPALAPRYAAADLPRVFAEAEKHFADLRAQVSVETPDPFINAAVAALNVAADAVWDDAQQDIMHGAIAWRTRLLGWRGPYALDALGWHDRARAHFRYWASRQNTSPIPEKIPPADEKSNLARNEAGLHSNGDMSNSHYDMNLVFIDALFRHLRWTGDLDFAREMWPVIERHLAWERRLFRREFTTASGEKLPLYEAYAAIWASDDLGYNGGGTAHASAYNYFHNKEAARLAKLLGHDDAAANYEREAELIARGMRELLWMPDRGMFAEYKDYLGLQLVHPSAALWSFYHVMDSEVPTPEEAWQMTGYVDRELPHIPVRGPGVPMFGDQKSEVGGQEPGVGDRKSVRAASTSPSKIQNPNSKIPFEVLGTSNWMPYSWSINNVVMGENIHTALGFWQAGRGDEAFRIMKGSLLASMFMGICPGNVGSMNYLDVYRRESQRDFADGSGVTSRAIVEGLFGIKPDALAGELRIEPGFPREWEHAKIALPGLSMSFERRGRDEIYVVDQTGAKPLNLVLSVVAERAGVSIRINRRTTKGTRVSGNGERLPRVEFGCGRLKHVEVVLRDGRAQRVGYTNLSIVDPFGPPPVFEVRADTQFSPVDLAPLFNDRVTQIFRHEYRSPRSPFVSLAIPKQGIGAWAGHVNATADIDDSGLRAAASANGGRITLPNGVPFATPGKGDAPNIVFVSQWDNFPREATVALSGRARRVFLLMAGSTYWMQSRIDNGEVLVTYADGTTARLALRNPETWWPIDQDYFIDDFQFRFFADLPTRVDLKTCRIRVLDFESFKGKGGVVPGGAATVLELPLDPSKELKSLTVRALANEVVVGLMSATLVR